jgi:hypothetical protein
LQRFQGGRDEPALLFSLDVIEVAGSPVPEPVLTDRFAPNRHLRTKRVDRSSTVAVASSFESFWAFIHRNRLRLG